METYFEYLLLIVRVLTFIVLSWFVVKFSQYKGNGLVKQVRHVMIALISADLFLYGNLIYGRTKSILGYSTSNIPDLIFLLALNFFSAFLSLWAMRKIWSIQKNNE